MFVMSDLEVVGNRKLDSITENLICGGLMHKVVLQPSSWVSALEFLGWYLDGRLGELDVLVLEAKAVIEQVDCFIQCRSFGFGQRGAFVQKAIGGGESISMKRKVQDQLLRVNGMHGSWLAGQVRLQSYFIGVFQWSSGAKINDVEKKVKDIHVCGYAACQDGEAITW